MAVLGIDVSKDDFHACLVEGTKRAKNSFPNRPAGFRAVVKWLRNRCCDEVHVCMEATGPYWRGLATALYESRLAVSVVNPSRTALFARSQLRRTKTDEVDAAMIADFCLTQQPGLWVPPASQTLELRGFLSYRAQLVAQRVALQQVAKGVHVSRELQRLHAANVKTTAAMIEKVEEQMRALVKRNAALKAQVAVLMTTPGIGFLTAATLVARLPVERLRDGKAAAAYVGLAPSERQSGSSVRGKPRICKTGNGELRRDLYMPAVTSMRYNPALKAFANRLKAKGKPGKVIVAAIMRKLVVLAYTLLKKDTTYDAAIAGRAA